MKTIELWHWSYYDPARRKRCTTRALLSEADAKAIYPDGATKVESSLEVREVPETAAELEAMSTSAFQRRATPPDTDR